MDQLFALDNKFNLPDTAVAALDIVLQTAAQGFSGNQLAHFPQCVQGAVIRVAPVDEGPFQIGQGLGAGGRAGDGPGLDHGIALPVPAVLLVVHLQGIEIDHQGTTAAKGPQAHVHPEHETVHGLCIQ